MPVIGELAVIFAVCLVGEGLSALLPVPFPASVLSLLLLLALLFLRLLRPRHVERVSGFLVDNMSLFFIPPCVGAMEYAQEIAGQLWPFLIISVATTPLVYLATAWTVQLLMRALGRKGGGDRA